MISAIASRPHYTPSSLRTEAQARPLPQANVRFGHSHEHVHADGSTCKDKHCTEGQKGERQFLLKPFFDWVKNSWLKFKDFVLSLFGKSKPQASTTTAASAPAATTTPVSAEQPKTQTAEAHQHHGAGHHTHSADGKCCGGRPTQAAGHQADSHSH